MFVSLALLLSFLPFVTDSTDDSLAAVRQVVEAYARPFDPDWETTLMQVEWADLNDDGLEDALVYLEGTAWCGSGGCTVLVLEAMPEEDAVDVGPYLPAAEISMMHGPITVAATTSNGWHDLLVQSETGDVRRLAFDGETYPFSPSDGLLLAESVESGRVLFADGR